MLDPESKATEGLEDEEGEDLDLISQLADLSIKPESSDAADGDTLVRNNPVFKESRPSSKIGTIVDELRKLKKKSEVKKENEAE